ncbi:ArsR/SmtB family transcription factor [Campylobacter sp. VTCC 70190]|uniref:ArsR/SmtB family transcription factor n=1 Tax=Campylobacter sp. VTCC 70190 TaxID=3392118 RepID=UPI00398F5B16
MNEFLKITAALNDESRILILAFLQIQGKLCVCDLQLSLKMNQSRLSRHLKILKEAGFLEVNRKDVWAYYGIKNDLCSFCQSALDHISKLECKLPKLQRLSCQCP